MFLLQCLEFCRQPGVDSSVCFDCFHSRYPQELRPKGLDVRQEELGDLVDKEMVATSAAIEEAVRRIDVRSPKSIIVDIVSSE